METHFVDQDVFSFQTELPPVDHLSACCGYGAWDLEYAVSYADVVLSDPSFTSLDYNILLIPDGLNEQMLEPMGEKGSKHKNEDLCRETISKYFIMPIAEAARELNVGLTFLKRKCRELGIRRWPHRKLKSLQALIDNLKEMGEENTVETREYLEQEKMLILEAPNMQMGTRTKRLRQTCFKTNYKKRRLMGNGNTNSNCPQLTSFTINLEQSIQDLSHFNDDGDDEIMAFYSDFASSSDSIGTTSF